jgi:hypothetical protein
LKCQTKDFTNVKHLFVEDCINVDPGACLNFDRSDVAACCGWGNRNANGKFAGSQCPSDYLGA